MTTADLLRKIDFGNETADDAGIEELLHYFVEQPQFDRFILPESPLQIATAKKGVGKSALIEWAAYSVKNREDDALVVKCRGADLVGFKTPLSGTLRTPNDHIRNWMIRICALANRTLAARLRVAIRDDQMTLVETAELDGFKARNLVGALVDRLCSLLPNAAIEKKAAADEVSLFRRSKRPRLWLLVDDLDATFQNTPDENVELGTFFTACRYLAQDCQDVFFRVTMRTDVWSIVRRFDESLDKVEQYVSDIQWPLAGFRKLLYKRIRGQLESLGIEVPLPRRDASEDEIHRSYFDHLFAPTMQWGDRDQATYRVIYTMSYERPRWAIQLCKLAQASAIEDGRARIRKENFDEVWGEYGIKRIKDLVAEHKHQCAQIEELLNSFRGAERLMTRDQLMGMINNNVLTHLTPFIEGEQARSPRTIGHFLYRIGFILARSERGEGYEHYHYDEMPDFLSGRTDEDFGVKWEIHPCYREALDIRKLDLSHRRGFRKRRRFR